MAAIPTPNGADLLLIEPTPLGGTTDDPSPIGIVWLPKRAVEAELLLNAHGAANGDDRPDTTRNPLTGLPAAVWTYARLKTAFDISRALPPSRVASRPSSSSSRRHPAATAGLPTALT